MADKTILSRILKDQTGATAVEYGLLVGLMVVAAMLGMDGFANEMENLWHRVETGLSNQGSP